MYPQQRYLLSAARLWRYQPLQAFLCALGVVAGVGGLITALAIGEGAQRQIDQAIGMLGAGTMVVRSLDDSGDKTRIGADRVAAVRRLLHDEISNEAPVVTDTRTALAHRQRQDNVKIIGTNRNYQSAYRLSLQEGRFLTWHDSERRQRVCVLGWELGRQLFPQGGAVGQRVRLGAHWFSVVGWLQRRAEPGDELAGLDLPSFDKVAYVPVSTMGAAAAAAGIDELVLNFRDEADMLRVSGAVQRILEYDTEAAAFEYIMPIEMLRQKYRMQTIIRYLLSGVTAVMLAVGGIGIMNVLLVSVIRRRPEIGLRIAMGARRRDIITQFVTESTLVCVAGGLVGVVAGAAAAYGLAVWLQWPVAFVAESALLGLVVSVLVGVGFGSYPARQAALVTPMRTLNQG